MEGFEEGFVVKGGIKLPIGFRFCPTDQELLLHYLKNKAFAQQLPASVIPETDIFQTHPCLLPGSFHSFFHSFLLLFFIKIKIPSICIYLYFNFFRK